MKGAGGRAEAAEEGWDDLKPISQCQLTSLYRYTFLENEKGKRLKVLPKLCH